MVGRVEQEVRLAGQAEKKGAGAKLTKQVLEDLRDIERGILRLKEAVIQAIQEAKKVLEVSKKEKEDTERLKTILDFAYDGVVAIDYQGLITAFNPVAEKVTGVPSARAIGRPVEEVIPGSRLPNVLARGRTTLWRKLKQQERRRGVVEERN